jgi:hypothetical protein
MGVTTAIVMVAAVIIVAAAIIAASVKHAAAVIAVIARIIVIARPAVHVDAHPGAAGATAEQERAGQGETCGQSIRKVLHMN